MAGQQTLLLCAVTASRLRFRISKIPGVYTPGHLKRPTSMHEYIRDILQIYVCLLICFLMILACLRYDAGENVVRPIITGTLSTGTMSLPNLKLRIGKIAKAVHGVL